MNKKDRAFGTRSLLDARNRLTPRSSIPAHLRRD